LFLDAEQTTGDCRCGETHDCSDFIIPHTLQPKKNDGAVKQLKAVDPVVQHLDLSSTFIGITYHIFVDNQRNGWYMPLLATIDVATGVQADTPDPRLGTAVASELGKAFPEIDLHFLEKVFHFGRIV
jgi:hypothetical protein